MCAPSVDQHICDLFQESICICNESPRVEESDAFKFLWVLCEEEAAEREKKRLK